MPDDPTLTTLESSLSTLRGERAEVVQRLEALDRAIEGIASAISSLGGATAGTAAPAAATPPRAPSATLTRKRSKRPSAPKVSSDDLVAALRDAGGSATTAELVSALGVNDGRNLNGARRQAVDEGLLVVDDGTYRLLGDAAGQAAGGAPATLDGADEEDGAGVGGDDDEGGEGAPPVDAEDVTDEEWEASTAADGEGDLGRRFP